MHTCLELFSGIGGFAVAANQLRWSVSQAIDINQLAARVYRSNFRHGHQIRTIESLSANQLREFQADMWWLSPPCQPFTRRGNQRGVADTRMSAFFRVTSLIAQLQPARLAVENVPEFASSEAADLLRRTLRDSGYEVRELVLCPTDFGVPNRRRRYYLAAARDRPLSQPVLRKRTLELCATLDEEPSPELYVEEQVVQRYRGAMDCIDLDDAAPITSCFTSAYGKSPVRSGSYLRDGRRVRRFSPQEILRLLGFPDWFSLPPALTRRQAWRLVGNSLSIPVVNHVLRCLSAANRSEVVA